jgi:hypothetical protein
LVLVSILHLRDWFRRLNREASVVAALVQVKNGAGGRDDASALLGELLKNEDFSYHLRSWAGPRAGLNEVVDLFGRKIRNPGVIGWAARRALERQLRARGIPVDGKLLKGFLTGASRNPGDWAETFTGKSLPLFVPPSATDEELKAAVTLAKVFEATRVLLVVETGREAGAREAVKASGAESIVGFHVVPDGSYQTEGGSSSRLTLAAEGWTRLASELPGTTAPVAVGKVRLEGVPEDLWLYQYRELVKDLLNALSLVHDISAGLVLELKTIADALVKA